MDPNTQKDKVKHIGKLNFRSVLSHPMLSNANLISGSYPRVKVVAGWRDFTLATNPVEAVSSLTAVSISTVLEKTLVHVTLVMLPYLLGGTRVPTKLSWSTVT